MIDLRRTQQLDDIIHGTIQYSGIESAVISTPIFNRLHRILQSSMVYLTYSSNKVKRFEHSLGTMHLAGQILYRAFVNTEDRTVVNALLNEVKQEVLEWYRGLNFIHSDFLRHEISDQYPQEGTEILKIDYPDSTFYREFTPSNIREEDKFLYLVLFQALRLAALLHDVGHLPYSHILEDAIRELYIKVNKIADEKKSGAQIEFINVINPYYKENDNIHAIHEEVGIILLTQIKAATAVELPRSSDSDCLFFGIAFDFAQKILEAEPTSNTIFSDVHRIIAGVVDADRLDYCTRDLFCSGIRKDIFPYQKLIRTYRIIQQHLEIDIPVDKDISSETIRKRFLFCPSTKCITEVEELLNRRMHIFSQLNYNHRVHKHEVLFSNVLSTLGFNELAHADTLKPIKQGSALPLQVSSIWTLIKKLQLKKALIDYLVIQLDDSWMDTLLKFSFFDTYNTSYRDMKRHGSEPEWNRFDELISGSKRYRSLFKGIADFREFDILFSSKWANPMLAKDRLTTPVKVIDYDSVSPAKKAAIKKAQEEIRRHKESNASQSVVFNYMLDALAGNSTVEFFHLLEERINQELKMERGKEYHISDCIVRSCQFGLGLDTSVNPVFLWQKGSNSPIKLEAISNQRAIFGQAREFSPSFHLYYLPSYDAESMRPLKPNLDRLKTLVAELAADLIWEWSV